MAKLISQNNLIEFFNERTDWKIVKNMRKDDEFRFTIGLHVKHKSGYVLSFIANELAYCSPRKHTLDGRYVCVEIGCWNDKITSNAMGWVLVGRFKSNMGVAPYQDWTDIKQVVKKIETGGWKEVD